MTAPFARALLGWKQSSKNKLGWALVPNFTDVDNAESMRIGAGILDFLGVARGVASAVPKDPGGPLELAVRDHLADHLPRAHADRAWLVARGAIITQFDQYAHLSKVAELVRANPELRITVGMDYLIKPDVTVALGGRAWLVARGAIITQFDQYAHLSKVAELVRANPELRITVGMDYLIKPDVTVALGEVKTASGLPPLHAAISCKWTIRSDRVQNIRHECLQMIRHRRGRQPHLVTVTAEPLPSRLASIARGTGTRSTRA